jgi:hypothetical protein
LLHHGFFNAHVAEKRRDTDLQYQSTKQENWHTVVTAQVAADEVSPKLTESYASYSKRIKLEGFRKGKVPLHLVKKMFGKQIEEQVYGPYFQQAISEILKDDKYEPISMPEIENVRFDDAEGLTFQVTFDVRPVFAVQDLQDTAIEKIIYSIDKKDVENTLAALQQQNAMIHTVEGEAQIGHHVVGDIQELDRSGLPIIGRRYEKQTIFLHEEDKNLLPNCWASAPAMFVGFASRSPRLKSKPVKSTKLNNRKISTSSFRCKRSSCVRYPKWTMILPKTSAITKTSAN